MPKTHSSSATANKHAHALRRRERQIETRHRRPCAHRPQHRPVHRMPALHQTQEPDPRHPLVASKAERTSTAAAPPSRRLAPAGVVILDPRRDLRVVILKLRARGTKLSDRQHRRSPPQVKAARPFRGRNPPQTPANTGNPSSPQPLVTRHKTPAKQTVSSDWRSLLSRRRSPVRIRLGVLAEGRWWGGGLAGSRVTGAAPRTATSRASRRHSSRPHSCSHRQRRRPQFRDCMCPVPVFVAFFRRSCRLLAMLAARGSRSRAPDAPPP